MEQEGLNKMKDGRAGERREYGEGRITKEF